MLGILALVFGILSLLFLGLLFGPAAIVLGGIAGSRGNNLGWWGLGLGIGGALLSLVAVAACAAMLAGA